MSALTQQEYDQLKIDWIEKAEGVSKAVYLDSVGIPTVGIGWNLAIPKA